MSRREELTSNTSHDGRSALLVAHIGFTERLRRLFRDMSVTGIIGLIIVTIVIMTAIFAPWIAPHDPSSVDGTRVFSPPSRDAWLGGDNLGRDVFSRIVHGARVSVMAGFVATALSLVIGISIGLVAGYSGGAIDNVLMRLVDAVLAFPTLVFLIAVTSVLGPSLTNAMIAIGIAGFPTFARLVRGEVLSVRSLEYIEAAASTGANPFRIAVRHVFPNITAPVIVWASLSIAIAILAEASLSFLGLGVQAPTPSWGSMINTGNSHLERAPWMALSAGGAIFLAVFGANLVGDMLRDLLDPRLRGDRTGND